MTDLLMLQEGINEAGAMSSWIKAKTIGLPTRLVGFDSEEHGHVLMPAWARRP